MNYSCPVCGYGQLIEPPEEDMICPCCGTQFGYHDSIRSHDSLRQHWIKTGCRWHSRRILRPVGWNAYMQLIRAGFGASLASLYTLTGEGASNEVPPALTIGSSQSIRSRVEFQGV